MESVKPSTPLAALHYRSLQRQLLFSKVGKRNPGKVISLTGKSLMDYTGGCPKMGWQEIAHLQSLKKHLLFIYGQMPIQSWVGLEILVATFFKGNGLMLSWLQTPQ